VSECNSGRPCLEWKFIVTEEVTIMPRVTDHLLRQHLDSLGVHLRQCRTLSDRRLRMLCSLEALDAAIGERVFTTVVLGSVVIAAILSVTV